jgi:Ca-activated chloride channel homolog
MPIFTSLLWLLVLFGPEFLDETARHQSKTDRPIAMTLLVDNSLRLEPNRGVIRAQVADFVRTLRPNDIAELIEFSNDMNVRQRFTSDKDALTRALAKSTGPSGRAVYGAVHKALKELDKCKSAQCADRRLTVVVIAGGPDISSVIAPNQLLAFVRRAHDVRIYGVAVPVKGHSLDREIEMTFRQMAQLTGGRAFFPDRVEDLPGVYAQLRDDLVGASTASRQRPGPH